MWSTEHSLHQPDPVEVIERTLRELAHDMLSGAFGPDWVRDDRAGLGPGWVKNLERKSKADQGARKAEAVYDLPLAYAEFSELRCLLLKHRELFDRIFPDWDSFAVYITMAERLRNVIKHHRDIAPTQHALLIGMAGEIEDAVQVWRIGTQLEVKRTVLIFEEFIRTDAAAEAEILALSRQSVQMWKERLLGAVRACGKKAATLEPLRDEPFYVEWRSLQLDLLISTAPDAAPNSRFGDENYKHLHIEVRHNTSCDVSLDTLLAAIDKPYRQIAYHLDAPIDVGRLRDWSAERAGLNPNSSGAFNGELRGITYRLLGGKLSVGAGRYGDDAPDAGGVLSASLEPPDGFWSAHRLIGPKQLLGFMLGSITPRAMVHLVRLAQLSPGRKTENVVPNSQGRETGSAAGDDL